MQKNPKILFPSPFFLRYGQTDWHGGAKRCSFCNLSLQTHRKLSKQGDILNFKKWVYKQNTKTSTIISTKRTKEHRTTKEEMEGPTYLEDQGTGNTRNTSWTWWWWWWWRWRKGCFLWLLHLMAQFVAYNYWTTVNNEMERSTKQASVEHFNALSSHFPVGTN